jgi:hypothetical protein
MNLLSGEEFPEKFSLCFVGVFCVERTHLLEIQVMTENKLCFDGNKSKVSWRKKRNKVNKTEFTKKKYPFDNELSSRIQPLELSI